MQPAERFAFITCSTSISKMIAADPTNASFGLNRIEAVPMAVHATILPQAKLLYAQNKASKAQLITLRFHLVSGHVN